MRILCVTDFPVRPPDRWIWNYLPSATDSIDFLWHEASDRSARWGKLLTRYPGYHRLALQSIMQCKKVRYDAIVAWEGKVGIPLAFWRRIFRCKTPPFIILTFTPGDLVSASHAVIRWSLSSVDHLTVLTSSELERYHKHFSIPRERMSLILLGMYDVGIDVVPRGGQNCSGNTPYIHASGRSARDYATLLRGVEGTSVRTVIHGRGYNFAGLTIPPNVEIGELVPNDQYHKLVRDAAIEVVPLIETSLPVGSSQIVYAMMMGKPIVATRTTSTIDYIEDGVTGLLVAPGDSLELRRALDHMLRNPQHAAEMGLAARRRFEERHTYQSFALTTYGVLQKVIEHRGAHSGT